MTSNLVNELKAFLETNPSDGILYGTELTCLHTHVSCGNYEHVKLLLENKVNPNMQTLDGTTPLFTASRDVAMTKLLLEYKADPSAKNKYSKCPLSFASDDVTKILLEANADPNVQDMYGETRLMSVFYRYRCIHMTRLLLEHKANPRFANMETGQTMLHEILEQRLYDEEFLDIVPLLLDAAKVV